MFHTWAMGTWNLVQYANGGFEIYTDSCEKKTAIAHWTNSPFERKTVSLFYVFALYNLSV